jgi:RNA polymerase sigma-70 factor, ECF subfamily
MVVFGEIFVRAWAGSAGRADQVLEDALVAACRSAREAWPGIGLGVADEAFVEYLACRLPSTCDDLAAGIDKLRVTDLYLACACVHGDPAAMAAFDAHFLSGTAMFLQHIDASPPFVDEVTQLLRGRLMLAGDDGSAPRLAQYAGRGPLAKWVGVGAQRTALSLLRSDRTRTRVTSDAVAEALPVGHDPELDYLRVRYREDFRAAFSAAIEALSVRDRVILRLHLVDRLSHERIATMYRVNQSTVTRWIGAARQRIQEHAHDVLRDRLRADTAELDSLAAVVGRDLDLSLSRLLGTVEAAG